MTYNFDNPPERRGTGALKYDFNAERGRPEDALQLWIADFDFALPAETLELMRKRVDLGNFGYSEGTPAYYNAVINWFKTRHGYEVSRDEIIKTPGVMFGMAAAVHALTQRGDAILIQPPVYKPFFELIHSSGRKLAENHLVYKDGRYRIDFEDFERQIVENGAKLFFLCNPHNPVGRVWDKAELEALRDICGRHGVTVISDEIHCDFTYPGYTYTSYGTLSDKAVIVTAPSKTFNIAGLQVSNSFIRDKLIREKYKTAIDGFGYSQIGTFGLAACESLYTTGAEWFKQLQSYLHGNLVFFRRYLAEKLPRVKLVDPEGTFLYWLDFSSYGLPQKELDAIVTNKAKLWLEDADNFGSNIPGFERINGASPRSVLKLAIDKLQAAFS
ncbi:MAG: pyridoxal phosphate-dependent aminotransferase [Oscillospiraceae bacterium]|jgi:cystathionine beta-lyase|nr:pyridoxal phosphate-dependent aminotransferase [Oscillospiraceae bacterium]